MMPKAKRTCQLEALDQDAIRIVLQHCDFRTLAKVAVASAQIASQLVADLLTSTEVLIRFEDFSTRVSGLGLELSSD